MELVLVSYVIAMLSVSSSIAHNGRIVDTITMYISPHLSVNLKNLKTPGAE
jgi:hypothetical protein